MTRNYLVLIGPPGVGKTTLANKMKDVMMRNCKIFSFDKQFPIEKMLNENGKNSKDFRGEFLEMIRSNDCDCEWFIIDDTCHFKSMQKRYIPLESESAEGGEYRNRVIFLYISAKTDQISELQRRNLNRNRNRLTSSVNSEDIDRITRHLNSFPPKNDNMIEFNYKNIPEIAILMETLKEALKNYTYRSIDPPAERDTQSDSNYFNRLNLALNAEISKVFQEGEMVLNGPEVAKHKKKFVLRIRQSELREPINQLIEEFRINYLH